MLKRLILCKLMILAIVLTSLPVSKAQTIAKPDRDEGSRLRPRRISSYDDDPFVADSVVERMTAARFGEAEDGRPILRSNLVWIEEEPVIYREDSKSGEYIAFATNPWPLPMANAEGNFTFPGEARFPLHRVERGPDGKIVLKDGLQLWLPQDLNRGMTTAFEAVNAAKDAAESWAGRELVWGENGRLDINAHAFIDFNAFFSPTARMLFFGVVPHRLHGEPSTPPSRCLSWPPPGKSPPMKPDTRSTLSSSRTAT